MTKKIKRIMIIAGGTGGHVFPGIEIMQYLMAHGWQVRWLGTADRIEATIVPKYGIAIDFIRISSLRGKGLKAQLIVLMRMWYALYQSRCIMRIWRPDVVLGMGGYVSGPGVLAAWSCGIPVVLHEQNVIAGLTNRSLAKIASKVLQAFPGALPHAEIVGNPVRNAIKLLPAPEVRLRNRTGPIRILVTGGSQGAHLFNKIIPAVAGKLSGMLTIWHQVGKNEALNKVKQAYLSLGEVQHNIVDFIDDIASAYAWADIIICRAGALTVSEITVAGLPAIFVPFIHKDKQQYWNALPLENVGAAKIIEQSEFNVDRVSEVLSRLDRSKLLIMALRAKAIAISDSTERIAREVIAVTCASEQTN